MEFVFDNKKKPLSIEMIFENYTNITGITNCSLY